MTVYRCWAIWGRNWLVVAVPILTLIATFGESPCCVLGNVGDASDAQSHPSCL